MSVDSITGLTMDKYKGNIVITGTSTGIGYAAALKFVNEGYRVFGSVRKSEDGVRLAQELGPQFTPLDFDVTRHDEIYAARDKVADILESEGVDLLINNAGMAVSGPTMFIPIEDYRYQFEVNLFGLIETTKAFLPLLGAVKDCKHPPGKIMNISSVAGQLVFPFMGPYAASKHAVEGFSHTLRRELMIFGIDVIIIAPGSIKTPIWEKVEDLTDEVMESMYGEVVSRFRSGFVREAEEGLEVQDFVDDLFKIYLKRRPKARYAMLNKKWIKWTVPRYLFSHRFLDRYIKKILRMDG